MKKPLKTMNFFRIKRHHFISVFAISFVAIVALLFFVNVFPARSVSTANDVDNVPVPNNFGYDESIGKFYASSPIIDSIGRCEETLTNTVLGCFESGEYYDVQFQYRLQGGGAWNSVSSDSPGADWVLAGGAIGCDAAEFYKPRTAAIVLPGGSYEMRVRTALEVDYLKETLTRTPPDSIERGCTVDGSYPNGTYRSSWVSGTFDVVGATIPMPPPPRQIVVSVDTAGNYAIPVVITGFDAITGEQVNSSTVTINLATSQTLSCSPSSQTISIDGAANLSASGGGGTYSWSAPGGNPSSGSGSDFSVSYASGGLKTVTASSSGESASCSVSVEAINCEFSADPTEIIPPAGESTLSWNCSGADVCSINQGVGSVDPVSGSVSVSPDSDTIYTLSCVSEVTSASYSIPTSVIVSPPDIEEVVP